MSRAGWKEQRNLCTVVEERVLTNLVKCRTGEMQKQVKDIVSVYITIMFVSTIGILTVLRDETEAWTL